MGFPSFIEMRSPDEPRLPVAGIQLEFPNDQQVLTALNRAFGLGWALVGSCPGPLFALIGNGIGVMFAVLLSAVLGTRVYGALRPRLPH